MFTDSLSAHSACHTLNPAFPAAFAWLERFSDAVADGNHDIGAGCEARVMSYRTELEAARRWESHRRFIDIQAVMRGVERIDVASVGAMHEATPYDDANDVTFYVPNAAAVSSLVVRAGEFAIFWPHDAHRPNIALDLPHDVRKVVIKVPVIAVLATV